MMAATTEQARPREKVTAEEWLRRACTLVVVGVAAYVSYQHQRGFARERGSDPVEAVLWPLAVDGLLVLATVGVLTSSERTSRRYSDSAWASNICPATAPCSTEVNAADPEDAVLTGVTKPLWGARSANCSVPTP